MKIPFVDLKSQYITLKTEIDEAISAVINSTAFIGGRHVDDFEKKFASLYGVKHCVSTANGTDSLYITMKMLGIGPGDEVITSAYSWISSSETISQTGAKPVFVDIDDYFSIDAKQIESKITPLTKAIIPVHIHGQMCDMQAIMEIAAKFGLHVIEDCAQSHFSEFNGKRAGLFGIAGSFSFYPGKNLGAYGDAGCIITNDDHFARRARMYSKHGALKKHEHQMEGLNSRLDGLQAAILNVKLPYILGWTEQRIVVARAYEKYLSDISHIELPQIRQNTKHSFHLFVIKVSRQRELADFLKLNGVEVAIHYPVALPNMEAYKYLEYKRSDFPIASSNEQTILSLPLYPELSEEKVQYVSNKIREFYTKQ